MISVDNHNVPQQLQTLRNKIRISDGERKAMYHELEKKKRVNEEYIQKLRDDIADLNKLKSQDKRIAENTYNRLLRNKQLANAYKNKNTQEIMEEIEHQVFEHRRKLDLLIYKKNHLVMKLKKLAEDESRELSLTSEKSSSNPDAMKLGELESKVTQIKIKTQETRFITQQYLSIKEKLNQEQRHYKQRMDAMEEDILKWISEKKQMKNISDVALHLRDDMIADITNFESNISRLKAQFERESKEKKNLEKEERNRIVQALKRKSAPYSSRMWEEVLSQIKNPAEVASEERELASHISLFDLIKDKTGTATPGDIIQLSKTQDQTSELLKEKEATLTSQFTTIRRETTELEKTLHELKYKESEEYADTFLKIEELKEKMASKQKLVNDITQNTEHIGEINVSINAVLEELARKLDLNREIVNIQSNSSHEYSLILLDLCLRRMLDLQEEASKVNPEDVVIQPPSPPSETQEVEAEKFTSDDLGIVYNKFLTRNVVKQMSKQITAAHAKMKKQMLYNPDFASQKQK